MNEKYKVAYQGVPGSYSYQAMFEYFGNNIAITNKQFFPEVFEAISKGEAEYGIVPFENSTTGGVYEVFDLLQETDLSIVGERCIEVKHQLIGQPQATFETVDTVYSHPQALEQCSRFLRDHQFQSVPTSNTAVAVQMVKEGKQTNIAALGSAFAAGLYGLKILKNDVNNYFNNITKFIILHKNKRDDKTNDKISLVFTTAHKPGALYQALGFFAQNEINLLKLISRPTRNTPWEYSYFVDIEGNQGDWKVQRALKDLKASSPHFKIFGNYRAHHLEAPN